MKQRELRIDPEYQALIPPLTDEEYKQLEDNILSLGRLLSPIIECDGVILDGHNRYRILQDHPEIPLFTETLIFDDRSEALEWICSNQLGRRNLTPEQKRYLTGKKYEAQKRVEEFYGNQYTLADESGVDTLYQHHGKSTRQRLAEEIGMSEAYVQKADTYARGLDNLELRHPGSKEKILSGELKIPAEAISRLAKKGTMAEIIMAGAHVEKLYQEYLKGCPDKTISTRLEKEPSEQPDLPARYQSFEGGVFMVLDNLDGHFRDTPELLSDNDYRQKVITIMERVEEYICAIRNGVQADELIRSWQREGDNLA